MTDPARTDTGATRTRLVTLASILAVGAAGAVAIGANIGILDAADDSNVGELSAAGDLTTPQTQVVDVYVDTPVTTESSTTTSASSTTAASLPEPAATAESQQFVVDDAGIVTLGLRDGAIRLDSVTPAAGWLWQLTQAAPDELTVRFGNGSRTLELVAQALDDAIAASVNELVPSVAPSNGTPPPATSASGGDDHAEEDDDGDHEDGDHEDEEHDDEDHEYEGGEDDD